MVLAAALVYAIRLPNLYTSSVTLVPNEQVMSAGFGVNASGLSSLASIAGVSIPAPKVDKVQLALTTLQSRRFISQFVDTHGLLVPLMAAKAWQRDANELVIDPGIYSVESETWTRPVPEYRDPRPSQLEAYEVFASRLNVIEDRRSGSITLTFTHVSPTVARDWLELIVADLNAEILQQDVDEARRAIEFLEERIASTSLAEVQAVLFDLIEENMKTMMLAQMSPDYIFRVIDPPLAPERKSAPNRPMILVFGIAFAAIIGLLAVLAADAYQRRRRAEA